jgi:hypothetical protein
MDARVRKLAPNDVGGTQHLYAVVSEHDRVEEIEFAFARLIDHASGEAAVEGKNHPMADRYRGLRLLQNDRQGSCGVCEFTGKMHGEGPHYFHAMLLLPILGAAERAFGGFPKRIKSAVGSRQVVHCATLASLAGDGERLMNIIHFVKVDDGKRDYLLVFPHIKQYNSDYNRK